MNVAELNITPTMRDVYRCLINFNDRHNPRTQRQVYKILGLSQSTVSDCVQKLIQFKFIAPIKGMRYNKIYVPGKYSQYIERQIILHEQFFGNPKDAHGRDITAPTYLHSPTARLHLNGGYIYANVLKEGLIESIPSPLDPRHEDPTRSRPFTIHNAFMTRHWTTNGGTDQYDGVFIFNSYNLGCRYIRSKNGKMRFGISPEQKIVTEIPDSDDPIEAFSDEIIPFLQYLEKFAGWKFQTDDDSQYLFNAKTKLEIGFDDTISAALMDCTGERFGVPGQTPLHADGSIPGRGEAEATGANAPYSASEYYSAIVNTPYIQKVAFDSKRKIAELLLRYDELSEGILATAKTLEEYRSHTDSNLISLARQVMRQSEVDLAREILKDVPHADKPTQDTDYGGMYS